MDETTQTTVTHRESFEFNEASISKILADVGVAIIGRRIEAIVADVKALAAEMMTRGAHADDLFPGEERQKTKAATLAELQRLFWTWYDVEWLAMDQGGDYEPLGDPAGEAMARIEQKIGHILIDWEGFFRDKEPSTAH